MPLPSSGAMRMGADIGVELGNTATSMISLGATAPRTLAGIPSGAIRVAADFYGKASAFVFNQTISSNTNDYNLKNAAIAAGWDQVLALDATVTINAGVFVGSSSTGSPAFTTGSGFTAGTVLRLINNGFIVGRGGNGGGNNGTTPSQFAGSGGGGGAGVANSSGGATGIGFGAAGGSGGNTTAGGGGSGGFRQVSSGPPVGAQYYAGNAGSSGGLALQVSAALNVTNNGTIGGGGGGGGQGASRILFGEGGQVFVFEWLAGGNGGTLGNSGSAGTSGTAAGGAGGAAGAAVSGNSNITWLATGTRLGAIS